MVFDPLCGAELGVFGIFFTSTDELSVLRSENNDHPIEFWALTFALIFVPTERLNGFESKDSIGI